MGTGNPKYSIDTCSLTAMRRIYPRDVFPSAWRKIEGLVESETLIAVEEVLEELKAQDDELLEWASDRLQMFVPLDQSLQTEAKLVLSSHPNLVDLKKRKSGADPFVIASAIVNDCTVVTEEKPSGGPGRPKIPDVCRAYKVECITVLEMLRREGLRV